MTTLATSLDAEVMSALASVIDPELDEPITGLGFVRSVTIDDLGVEVHLRLPTSFCAPNFAYLMASDAQDALSKVPGIGQIKVELDDHHDSNKINAGLAANAGYVGTFGVEAEEGLDKLRRTFQEKAHTAAMERSCAGWLKQGSVSVEDLYDVALRDLPSGRTTEALLRRRADIGLSIRPQDPVLVDGVGNPIPLDEIPLKLRFAKTVRISMEGNSHFCRGLLATRYEPEETNGMTTRILNTRRSS